MGKGAAHGCCCRDSAYEIRVVSVLGGSVQVRRACMSDENSSQGVND